MAFFDAPMFSPQNYAGQDDRWLDLFKMMQTQVQPGSFPDMPGRNANAQGGQQGPVDGLFGGPDLSQSAMGGGYGGGVFSSQPQPAMMAQAQGTMPAVQPQRAENPFMTGLQGFIGNLHNGPIGAIAGGLGGLVTGKRTDPGGIAERQANVTQQSLIARGFDADLAKVVASDPGLLRAVLPNLLGTAGQTDDIKEYQFAKKEEPGLTFQQFMQRKRAVSGEYGLTPIWGTGPDGKPAYIQPGKSGDARLAKLPEGFNIARDPIKVDLGTHYALLDPQTRQTVGTLPKNLAEAEKQKGIGETQGKAAGALPAAIIDAEETAKKVDKLLEHEGIDSIVGAFDQYRPTWALGDAGRNALARLEQLQGGAFLQAYNTLKGGGAITEMEGAKAERAVARMQRSQNEKDFREALMDFRDAVTIGVRKLRASAGETGVFPDAITKMQPAGTKNAPDLKSKYGLD